MRLIVNLLLASLVAVFVAAAAAAEPAPGWTPPESKLFPGNGVVVPAFDWLGSAPMHYWMVYEHWPERWQDVVDAGFVTQPLYDPFGKVMNPDDGSWDFPGDVQYSYQGEAVPLIVPEPSPEGTDYSYPTASCTATWEQMFAMSVQKEAAEKLKGNKERQRQLSVCSLIREGATRFYEAYGRLPASYAELAESGFSPLTPGTINPLTGKPYRGLGEPNDFVFVCSLDDGSKHVFIGMDGKEVLPKFTGPLLNCTVYPTDEHGERFWQGSI
jgi:hypothetical protein